MSDKKEIRWVGSAYDDLLAFPDEPRRSQRRAARPRLPQRNLPWA